MGDSGQQSEDTAQDKLLGKVQKEVLTLQSDGLASWEDAVVVNVVEKGGKSVSGSGSRSNGEVEYTSLECVVTREGWASLSETHFYGCLTTCLHCVWRLKQGM